MLMVPLLLGAVLFLAYTNGANDNFKGVATLFGSKTANYKRALAWATATTFAGSMAALLLSRGLVKAFSGKGLVPAALTVEPAFLLAVGLGAALTVLLATLTGFPVSTTHALTGALAGAGAVAAGSQVNFAVLGQAFFLPLLISPFLSFATAATIYPVFRFARASVGITKQLCLCAGPRPEPVLLRPDGTGVVQSTGMVLSVGELKTCVEQYQGVVIGIDCQKIVDALHYLSAGAVGFARGLNDTPKIIALLIAAGGLGLSGQTGLLLVSAAMAIGGILNARKVAETMSHRITAMTHGQGFTANLTTSLLVTLASRFGMPVSTTHVSCGALFGIGTVTGEGHPSVIRSVILSWIVTLPVAASSAALIYWLQRAL